MGREGRGGETGDGDSPLSKGEGKCCFHLIDEEGGPLTLESLVCWERVRGGGVIKQFYAESIN